MVDDAMKGQWEKAAQRGHVQAAYYAVPDQLTRFADRISTALSGTPEWVAMDLCYRGGTACGSVFCEHCRTKKQSRLLRAYRDRVGKEFSAESQARERLRWVTVLHTVVPVHHDTAGQEQETIACVVNAVDDMKLSLSNVARTAKRKSRANLWLRGGIHIELVDYEMLATAHSLGKPTTKQRTLSGLIEASEPAPSGKYFLVHFHALVDLDSLSEVQLKALLVERWNLAPRQVLVQRTWTKIKSKGQTKPQSVDDGLKRMAKYCFNMSNARLDYSKNWGSGSVVLLSGVECSAKGHIEGFAEEVLDTTPDERLSFGHIKLLIKAHSAVASSNHRGLSICIS